MPSDITNKEDIRLLVDTFYSRVLQDQTLAPYFAGLDFEMHKPKMVHFWSFVLLDESGYVTNVFDKHVHLPLQDQDFDVWLGLFEKTVNDLFEGEKASTAIFRAKTIAWTFKEKFKKLRDAQ